MVCGYVIGLRLDLLVYLERHVARQSASEHLPSLSQMCTQSALWWLMPSAVCPEYAEPVIHTPGKMADHASE